MDKFERITKGKRLQQQTEEELEADNEFWGQQSFREEEQDENYLTEEEPEDIFESDFDKSENENEEGDDEEGDKAEKKKTTNKKKSQKYLETIPGMKKAIIYQVRLFLLWFVVQGLLFEKGTWLYIGYESDEKKKKKKKEEIGKRKIRKRGIACKTKVKRTRRDGRHARR
eukprot:TRINITY_DN4494_c0_g1_i2.p2 TRINITY_DN4494_c0_g1~~TRINITY_DN4494_c0_g1_i2.p2  ORF type:complete len:170 (-),score=52.52 TRINITY_DN4494_c0_g1_i2:797-1306(-)